MLHDASSIFKNGIGFGKAPGFIILLKEISFLGGNIFFLTLLFGVSNGKGTVNCAFVTEKMSFHFLYLQLGFKCSPASDQESG